MTTKPAAILSAALSAAAGSASRAAALILAVAVPVYRRDQRHFAKVME